MRTRTKKNWKFDKEQFTQAFIGAHTFYKSSGGEANKYTEGMFSRMVRELSEWANQNSSYVLYSEQALEAKKLGERIEDHHVKSVKEFHSDLEQIDVIDPDVIESFIDSVVMIYLTVEEHNKTKRLGLDIDTIDKLEQFLDTTFIKVPK
jgi:hypothetical protein